MAQINKSHALYQQDLQQILALPCISQLHGKTILITGATGLIGMHLIDALMLMGDVNIIAVGRNREKAAERLGEYYDCARFRFVEQDVCQPFAEDLHPDFIIPLASNTHPLAYSKYPIETLLTNIKGAEHALNKAVQCNATVLYPSTVEVYGNARGEDVFTEDYTGNLNLRNSRAAYPESKRTSEAMCQAYIAQSGANVKIARLSRIFGPTMLMSDTKASSQFILKAVANEDIILKSKGDQFFSYTYVTDAVTALLQIMLCGETGVPYNISNVECNVHLRDFAQLCAEYNAKNVVFDLPSDTEMRGYSIASKAILDNESLASIGWKPAYDMKNAVQRTIRILRNE